MRLYYDPITVNCRKVVAGLDLIGAGYSVEVVADAISSRTAANRQVGLDKMSRAGAGITSVETALFELLREAGTPPFKEIARLVK